MLAFTLPYYASDIKNASNFCGLCCFAKPRRWGFCIVFILSSDRSVVASHTPDPGEKSAISADAQIWALTGNGRMRRELPSTAGTGLPNRPDFFRLINSFTESSRSHTQELKNLSDALRGPTAHSFSDGQAIACAKQYRFSALGGGRSPRSGACSPDHNNFLH